MLAFALENIKKFIKGFNISAFATSLKDGGDPINYITTEILAKQILPAAIPIVTAFVEMPAWAKDLLIEIGQVLMDTLSDLKKVAQGLWPMVLRIANILKAPALDAVPVSAPWKKLLGDVWDGLVGEPRPSDNFPGGALRDFSAFKTNYFDNPKKLLGAVFSFLKTVFDETDVIALVWKDSRSAPERDLVKSGLSWFLGKLGGIINSTTVEFPAVQAILSDAPVVGTLERYATTRIQEALSGTGLEALVPTVVGYLIGADSPLRKGTTWIPSFDLASVGRGLDFLAENIGKFLKQQASSVGRDALLRSSIETLFESNDGFKPMIVLAKSAQARAMTDSDFFDIAKRVFAALVDSIAQSSAERDGPSAVGRKVSNVLSRIKGALVSATAPTWASFTASVRSDLQDLSLARGVSSGALSAANLDAGTFLVDDPGQIVKLLVPFLEETTQSPTLAASLGLVAFDALDATKTPSKRAALAAKGPAFARRLALAIVDTAVPGSSPTADLIGFATALLQDLLEGATTPSSRAANLAAILKPAIGGLVTRLAALGRQKIERAMSGTFGAIRRIVLGGLDRMTRYFVSVLSTTVGTGDEAPAALLGVLLETDGKRIVSTLADLAQEIIMEMIDRAIPSKALQSLVSGVARVGFSTVIAKITTSTTLNTALTGPEEKKAFFTRVVREAAAPALRALIVEPLDPNGVARKVADWLVSAAVEAFTDPAKFADTVSSLVGPNPTDPKKVCAIIAELGGALMNELTGKMSGTLKTVVSAVVDQVKLNIGTIVTACK
jgi:hypothetical protein